MGDRYVTGFGLWKHQSNPACTKSVKIFIVLKLGTIAKEGRRSQSFLDYCLSASAYNVLSLSCSATGQTSISITWSLPSNLAGDLTGYLIDVTRNDGLKTETYAVSGVGDVGDVTVVKTVSSA